MAKCWTGDAQMKHTSPSASSSSDCAGAGAGLLSAGPFSGVSTAGALPLSCADAPRPPGPSLLPRPRPRPWLPPRPRPLASKLSCLSSEPPCAPLARPRPLPPRRCALAGTCEVSWAPVEAMAGYRGSRARCVFGRVPMCKAVVEC